MSNIEGRQPILELLQSNQPINKLLIQKGNHHGSLRKIIKLAKEKKVIIQEVEKQYLDKLSTTQAHQGVIAQASPISYWELEDLILETHTKNSFYLVLDGIEDPGNFGSLLRSAEIAGVDGVIIPKRRAVPVTPTVVKVSAGAASLVKICRVNNIAATLRRLKDAGCWIIGADMDGEVCYTQELTGSVAIVIGSEGKGISRLAKENCDLLTKIPMYGTINSFNAAVAGAVLMYEVIRQRNIQNTS